MRGLKQTVSASKERKAELELERKRQREEEAKAERKSMALYGVIAAVVAVFAVAMLVLNSGLLQRSVAAVTVNGNKFTAADMQYYYNMEYATEVGNSQTYAMYGMPYSFDYTVDPAKQVYDEATGQTWDDYFVEKAKDSVTYVVALSDAAEKAGHTLSENGQKTLDGILSNLDTAWIGSYNSREAFMRANYGSYMTYDRFVELLEMEVMASDYLTAVAEGMVYDEADYQAYYAEHADALDTYTVSRFVVQARVPEAAEGQELTEEEKAAGLEQDKIEKKALAEEILTKLNAGEDAAALGEEYAEQLLSYAVATPYSGDSIAAASYGEWAMDASRKAGDTTIAEYTSSTVHNYYVVRFEGRELDNSNTADVRHMLIAAAPAGETPTEEQYAEAKTKAEEILAGWDGTEEGFAALAQTNSADTGSAANGGLMTAVSKNSGYIQEFTDWSLAAERKTGDTGIIQNTGSSVKGWHIMYYVGDNSPVWELTADNALRQAEYTAWESEQVAGYEAVEGFGLKLI